MLKKDLLLIVWLIEEVIHDTSDEVGLRKVEQGVVHIDPTII